MIFVEPEAEAPELQLVAAAACLPHPEKVRSCSACQAPGAYGPRGRSPAIVDSRTRLKSRFND